MQWYITNEGYAINLQLVRAMNRDENKIFFIFEEDHHEDERYETEEEAEKAYQELLSKLTENSI